MASRGPCANRWDRNIDFHLLFAYQSRVITRRQKEVLDYLRAYLDRYGYAPTLREIGHHLGLGSLATVHKHLRQLEEKNLVRRGTHRSRALELTPSARPARAALVPLLGDVAAGRPREAEEVAETVEVPEELLGRGETFALRVRGDSMVGEGILDGDLVVVESRAEAPDGATVVALVDGEATVKTLRRERGGRVRLEPANASVAPIIAGPDRVTVRGVVIGLIRRYRR
jgi:repressor LexA